jgi:hypothetical protein
MGFCKEQTPINADRIPVAGNQAVVAADSELLTHGSHHCVECVSSQTDDDRRVDDFYQPPKQWFALFKFTDHPVFSLAEAHQRSGH